MARNNLGEFLIATKYCDADNKMISDLAKSFTDKNLDDVEMAVDIFNYVRDITTYKLGNWTKKASETLSERGGTCTNNSNLLVALMRAVKIPAGYGVMDVVGPDYFGPIVLPNFNKHVSKRTKHIYCYVYLNDKWLRCDPSDDEPLSVNTSHLNPQSELVKWNGISDAILNINKSHIISDNGPIPNIDTMIAKKMRLRRKIPVYFANRYLQFLRENGRKIQRVEDLSPAFNKWLLDKNLPIYIIYRIFFLIDSIITTENSRS
jgi:hypothetical protein